MKKTILLFSSSVVATTLNAADASVTASSAHSVSLLSVLLNVVIFAAVGISIAIAGFKVFDLCTPGDLQKEIIQNKNMAAAIIAAAVIIGVSIIIAACILG